MNAYSERSMRFMFASVALNEIFRYHHDSFLRFEVIESLKVGNDRFVCSHFQTFHIIIHTTVAFLSDRLHAGEAIYASEFFVFACMIKIQEHQSCFAVLTARVPE